MAVKEKSKFPLDNVHELPKSAGFQVTVQGEHAGGDWGSKIQADVFAEVSFDG